jgi:hypothetical protein
MIIDEINTIKSGKRELRQFGILIGTACALLGLLLWWRGKAYYSHSFIIAAACLFLGLTLPLALKPFHKIWMTISICLGWLMTRFILIILFYGILAPIGLLARLCNNDFLDLKIDKNAPSYWVLRDEQEHDKESYEQQF